MVSTERDEALTGRGDARRRPLIRGSKWSTAGVRRTLIAVTATAVALGTMVLAPTAAQAAPTQIKGAGSGRCIDFPGGGTDGAQMELWDCNGNANQAINQTSSGQLQVVGRCLDAEGGGTADGTHVIAWPCTGGSNQRWTFGGNGQIRGVASGKCIDAFGRGTQNGTGLVLWPCNGQANQSWSRGGSTGGGVGGGGGGGSTPPSNGGGSGPGATRPITVPPSLGTHDPSRVINDNGSYYFYSTSGNLSGWYTTDGRNWRQTPAVFRNGIPSSITRVVPNNNGVWAPDIIWSPTQRQFLMYYSIANWNNARQSAIGLVTSPTLNPNASNYRWTDRGVIIAWSNENGSTIDPAPFFDAGGNLWLTYGSGKGGGGINRAHAINTIAMNKNTGLRSDNTVHHVQSCDCEGAYTQYHAGYYYLFWNTGSCCSGAQSTYLINVARSTRPDGGFTGNRRFLGSFGSVHGPGHIGILSQNGTDYFTYHYYPNSGGSRLGIGTIRWSGGWPTPA